MTSIFRQISKKIVLIINLKTFTEYYSKILRFFTKSYRVILGKIMNFAHKITKQSTYLAKVSVSNKDRHKIKEKDEVTHIAMVRGKISNPWLDTTEPLKLINDTNLTTVKSQENPSKAGGITKNIIWRIEAIIKVNNTLSEIVDQEWNELDKEAKEIVKKYTESQFEYEEEIGKIENYRFTDKLLIQINSFVKQRKLLDEYKYSAEKLISSVLSAMERIELSSNDLKFLISNSGF